VSSRNFTGAAAVEIAPPLFAVLTSVFFNFFVCPNHHIFVFYQERKVQQMESNMEVLQNEMATMIRERTETRNREKHMLTIISWLLDMHSGMIEDIQSHQFLTELREIYQGAKINAENASDRAGLSLGEKMTERENDKYEV
jgi:hypothetical protein